MLGGLLGCGSQGYRVGVRLACESMAVLTLLLAACGNESGREDASASGPSNCDIAVEVQGEMVAELRSSSPLCQRDEDCVHVDTRIEAAGASVDLCGDVLHREAAARWDATAAAVLVEMRLRPSELSCGVQAACANGRPACAPSGQCELQPEP